MKNREKKHKILIITSWLIVILLYVVEFSIDIYNEKTQINLDTDEIMEVYKKYDIYKEEIDNNLKKICIFDQNNVCMLREEYEDSENYQYYNSTLLHISNLLNSSSIRLITEKMTSIKYEDLKFKIRMFNVKEMIKMIDTDSDSILCDYLNSLNRIITIHAEENYYFSKKNNLFNYHGKDIMYNDYRKIIETELEVYKIVYNITKYIERDLNKYTISSINSDNTE